MLKESSNNDLDDTDSSEGDVHDVAECYILRNGIFGIMYCAEISIRFLQELKSISRIRDLKNCTLKISKYYICMYV